MYGTQEQKDKAEKDYVHTSSKNSSASRLLEFVKKNEGVILTREQMTKAIDVKNSSLTRVKSRNGEIFKNDEKDLHTI